MNAELVRELGKLGMGTLALVILGGILYVAIKDDKDSSAFLRAHMERQTIALERITRLYSGEEKPYE